MNKESLEGYKNLINQLWESVGKKEMNDEEIMDELIVENYWLNRANDSLIDENRNYEKRIDKAIEYIEHKAKIRENFMINGKEYNELLDILKRK